MSGHSSSVHEKGVAGVDLRRMFINRAHAEAEDAAGEVLAAIQAQRYGYARVLLGKVWEYLDALDRVGVPPRPPES